MIGLTAGLGFSSSGGTPISGGSVTVPDDPADTGGGGDTGGGASGTGGGTDPTPTPVTLPLATSARWHPAFSTVTLDGDRIATATDLAGTAALTALPGTGPTAMTDSLGRPFWRFDGDTYLTVAETLILDSRDMAVFFVGRFHRTGARSAVFSIGSNAAGTAANSNGEALGARSDNQGMPLLQSYSRPSIAAYPSPETMVTGSQMQVAGMVGRANADGGTSIWVNEGRLSTSQPLSRPGVAGAEIGRYAFAPGVAGSWGVFDLYEMVVCDYRLTDTEGDSLSAALMAGYDIVPVTNQLVLEGDSIMQGTGDVTPGLQAGMILTDPGAPQVGPDWRVVNLAVSGSRVGNIENRRDTALGWPDIKASGQNVMAFEIGRNDMSPSFATTPAQHYANVVTYLTADFGIPASNIFARGWDVRVIANIASSVDYEADIGAYRALIRDPAFATALGTDAGGPHAGQMQIIDTDLITVAGETVFADASDAGDVTYYAGDSTHPNIAGAVARATGGDDPTKGIAFGLV